MAACSNNNEIDMKSLLPAEIKGWKPKTQDREFDQETIFDYIDGAGELYRAYDFKVLFARRYGQEGKPDIITDLFDMQSAENAFGIFTHDRLGEDAGIGQGSVYKTGLLSFWKDRFYVSLYTEEENEESKKAVLALGEFVERKIKNQGQLPLPVSWLPPDHLDPRSIRYFFNHHVLNMHFFMADGNILNLDKQCQAVLGTYKEPEGVSHLLVVKYPDKATAQAGTQSFKKAYMPEAGKGDLVQTENKKWTRVGHKNQVVVIHFDALTETRAIGLTEKCLERIKD